MELSRERNQAESECAGQRTKNDGNSAPDLVGEWSYSIHSADAGLNGQSGSFRCVPSKQHGSVRRMKDHPLHFEYQDGTPFWFFGEKAWRATP